MIVMKLGTISKLEKKNTMTPKKFVVDFLSAIVVHLVIFSEVGFRIDD